MPMIKDPRWSAINFDGTPAAGAEMYIYNAGTDILASLYTSDAFQDRLQNPLIADGYGYFPIAYLATGSYDVKLKNINGDDLGQITSITVI